MKDSRTIKAVSKKKRRAALRLPVFLWMPLWMSSWLLPVTSRRVTGGKGHPSASDTIDSAIGRRLSTDIITLSAVTTMIENPNTLRAQA